MILVKNPEKLLFKESSNGSSKISVENILQNFDRLRTAVVSEKKTETEYTLKQFEQLENRLLNFPDPDSFLDPKISESKRTEFQLVAKRVLDLIALHDKNPETQTAKDFHIEYSKEDVAELMKKLKLLIYSEKSTTEVVKAFQDIGQNLKEGLMEIPDNLAKEIFFNSSALGRVEDTANPRIDLKNSDEYKNIYRNNSELNKFAFLKNSGDVKSLQKEGVLVQLPDGKHAVNMELLKQKISQRTLGIQYLQLLKATGLWDLIKENYKTNQPALTALSAFENESLAKGENKEYDRHQILPNINIINVQNESNYLALQNYRNSLSNQFTQPQFAIPLEEVRELSQQAGVPFEINYKPDSFGMESAMATNGTNYSEGKLIVSINDNLRYSRSSGEFQMSRDNENTEGFLSLKLIYKKIIELRKNNPDLKPEDEEFKLKVMEIMQNNPDRIYRSASLQLLTLNRDRLVSTIVTRKEYEMNFLRGQGNPIHDLLAGLPEINEAIKHGQIADFSSLSPDQQAEIWKKARSVESLKNYAPKAIQEIINQTIKDYKNYSEIEKKFIVAGSPEILNKIKSGEIQKFGDLPSQVQTNLKRYEILKNPQYYSDRLNNETVKSFKELNTKGSGMYYSYHSDDKSSPDVDWNSPEEVQEFLEIANKIAQTDGRPVFYYKNPQWHTGSDLPPYLTRPQNAEEIANNPNLAWKISDIGVEVKNNIVNSLNR